MVLGLGKLLRQFWTAIFEDFPMVTFSKPLIAVFGGKSLKPPFCNFLIIEARKILKVVLES